MIKASRSGKEDDLEESKFSNEDVNYESFLKEEIELEEKLSACSEGEAKMVENDFAPKTFRNSCCPTILKYLTKANKIPKYLQTEPMLLSKNSFEKVALCSFPGSGSNLLRYYLQKATRVLTGSDCDINSPIFNEQLVNGFSGESRTDPKVWIVSTAFPYQREDKMFAANKCILLVRDPADCLYSYVSQKYTGSGYQKLAVGSLTRNKWAIQQFVEDEISNWVAFNEYWMSNERDIPVFIVRYEELLLNTAEVLSNLV
mmetsp:Transcript_10770/g.12121  ORF Transcript_10770/g.12121 Transcript_10770/m.12121 type:complete len:258 (+) Transcript_10770:159-932(+)